MDHQIDLGDHGWKHPGIEHMLYGSEDRAKGDAKSRELDPEEVYEEDTRPEIWRVAAQLEDEERIWDEGGPHLFPTLDRSEKWPLGRIKVFVVTGGSEGLYLHVEVEVYKSGWSTDRPETRLLLIAKTLSCDTDKWYECWMSAARIAKLLGA